MWKILFSSASVFFVCPVFADNPCHKGVPVDFAASSLDLAKRRVEIESKYGWVRQESVNALTSAQQSLRKEYARKAAYDFGLIGDTECFEYLSFQQWGQKLKLIPLNVKEGNIKKWLVYVNGNPSMSPSGETAESIFNRIGFFVQSLIYTDEYVASLIIEASQSAYDGPCPCPYNIDLLGNKCGARSAYSQYGGIRTVCFPADISQMHIENTRRDIFKKTYLSY